MLPLAELQGQFARAILNPSASVPAQVTGPDRQPSPSRFGVYRNNVVVGLIEALQAAYPIVFKIVGEDFFRAMARLFALGNPPKSPVMLEYGAGFADFIEGFQPAEGLPYLADVARLEWAWIEAYHAADADALTGHDLQCLDHGELPHTTFVIHPAVRVLKSDYPALAIWKMNVDDAVAPLEERSSAEEILVCRPGHNVNVYPLPMGTVGLLKSLASGATVSEAAAATLTLNPGFEITKALTGLIAAGAFDGFALKDGGTLKPKGEFRSCPAA